jgi:hypothetical protein
MDEHEAAVRRTGRKVAAHERERAEHIAAVVAALKAGKRPTDVASWSPFTPAHLRKLARGAGIPPARKGRSPGAP